MFAYRHFQQALADKDTATALTIILNLLAARPGVLKYLEGYVTLAETVFSGLDIAAQEKTLDDYRRAANKFLTYGYLTTSRLSSLKALDARIEALREVFLQNRQQLEAKNRSTSKKTNEEILSFLEAELSKLDEATGEKEFDRLLDDVKKAEKKLTLASMDESEKETYDRLIDLYASKIAGRTRDFENAALTKYNLECLDSLKELLALFKKSRRRLSAHFEMLEPLLKEKIFSYDTSKLFAATTEYYEYCYTYIFTRLSNDDKYEMARLALTTVKK